MEKNGREICSIDERTLEKAWRLKQTLFFELSWAICYDRSWSTRVCEKRGIKQIGWFLSAILANLGF